MGIADFLDTTLSALPGYREAALWPAQQQAAGLGLEQARLKNQRAGIENSSIQGLLDDLTRERTERAAAPAAVSRVMGAYAARPQSVTSDVTGPPPEGEQGDLGNQPSITTATPGRNAARTLPELLQRGASAEDFDIAEKQRPNTVKALGLTTPEGAQQADTMQRLRELGLKTETRGQELTDQLDQAMQSGDMAKARTISALLAAVRDKNSSHLNMILGGMDQGAQPEGEAVDLDKGVKITTASDSNGMRRTRVVPLSSTDAVKAHAERMVGLQRKLDTGESLTGPERQQYLDSWRFVNTVQPSQLQPGAYSVPRGPLSPPGATGAPGVPAGSPQGAYRGVPPVTTEGEAEKVGLRNSIITELEGAAKIGDKMPELQDWQGRGLLRINSWIQGHTPFETLTPEEQRWVTMHDRLRIMFEAGTMGLGPFRSPDMQAILAEIIGKYWTPGTGTRLRTLAQTLRAQGEATAATQAEGGRRPLSAPPAASPAPPTSGADGPAIWTLRETATGRTRRYQPAAGEAAPPAGYERVK